MWLWKAENMMKVEWQNNSIIYWVLDTINIANQLRRIMGMIGLSVCSKISLTLADSPLPGFHIVIVCSRNLLMGYWDSRNKWALLKTAVVIQLRPLELLAIGHLAPILLSLLCMPLDEFTSPEVTMDATFLQHYHCFGTLKDLLTHLVNWHTDCGNRQFCCLRINSFVPPFHSFYGQLRRGGDLLGMWPMFNHWSVTSNEASKP